MQNLLTIKEATMDAKLNEAESIETILRKLLTYCDCNATPLPGTTPDEELEAIFQVHERVAININ